MKIVYLIGYIHNSGGIERIVSSKANYLVNNGFEVTFIVIYKTNEKPFFYFDPKVKFCYLNFNFDEERGINKKTNFRKNRNLFLSRMEEVLLEIKPDISISTFCKYSKYIYMLNDGSKKIIERHFAKYKRAYYCAELDKYYLGRKITYLYRRSDYNIVKHFDRFVVLTNEDSKDWGNLHNIEVIENFSTINPKNHAKLDNKRLIALGRLNQQKQIDKLLKIWGVVAKKHKDWKLHIFGNDEKRDELEKLIKKLEIGGQTEIFSITKNVEMELLNSSIYVMTSKYEGFPLVLVEAMACGVPPVSFACKCGPSEIINDGEDGFLVPLNNEVAFAEKLSKLIEDNTLRKQMGEKAFVNIQRFSEDKIMAKWIRLFKNLNKR